MLRKIKYFSLIAFLIAANVYPNKTNDKDLKVKIHIRGEIHHFLFDTGFTHSIILEDVAKSLALEKTKVYYSSKKHIPSLVFSKRNFIFFKRLVGYKCSVNFHWLNKRTIEKGTFFIAKNLPVELGLSDVSGIIGWDLIRRFNWEVNFADKSVTPYKKEHSFTESVPDLKLAFKENRDNEMLPYITVTINQEHKFDVLFDTGANDFLTIDKNIFLLEEREDFSSTVYGRCKEKYVLVDSININKTSFKAKDIPIPIGVYSEFDTHKKTLGLGFLSLFSKMYINNRDSEILLYVTDTT